jgi:DNA (cytosine-5)-methyltransferase 1
MNDSAPVPTVLDLFAGAGGFTLGFHWVGFRTLVAIDHSPLAIETLEANFAHHGLRGLLRDLASFGPEDLRAYLRSEGVNATFDVIVGGPPCQGWSKVGRGKLRALGNGGASARDSGGNRRVDATRDPRNELYKRFLLFVGAFRPRVAIMENVPGMLSHDRRNVAEEIHAALSGLGYDTSVALLNAVDYGVPQLRERLFFVGVRDDLQVPFRFPPPTTLQKERLSVWDAIGDLPPIPNGAREWCLPYSEKRRQSAFSLRMREEADPSTVFDHVCRTQNEQDLEAFRLMRQGGWYRDLPQHLKRYRDDIFEDKYKKLYKDRPSWCVTAHLSKDCYTHIHPTQARTISIREAARLQSFPDCFYFAGNMGEKFGLIGNAVPPVLAEYLARAIREQVLNPSNHSNAPSVLPAEPAVVVEAIA